MWFSRHTSTTRLLFLSLALVLASGTPSVAQQAQQAQQEQNGPQVQTPTVDWSHAKQAHAIVEEWIHGGEVPAQADSPLRVRDVSGLRVTLRSRGQRAGAGEAYRENLQGVTGRTGAPLNLTPLLRRAAQQALDEAYDNALNARLKAVLELDSEDSPERPSRQQVGRQLQVSIQIGRRLEPIELGRQASSARIFAGFAPGYHGLRLVAGENGRGSFIWPATTLAQNVSPKSQLVQLLDDEGLSFQELDTVARPEGPRLQRFEIIHMVRGRAHMPVQELVRGNVLMPAHAVNTATVNGLARRLGQHLERRFTDGGRVRGTFHPSTGRYDPPVAEPHETALACYALTRHARWLSEHGGESTAGSRFAERALATAEALGQDLLEQDAPDAGAVALVVLTSVDTPLADTSQSLRDDLTDRLVELHVKEGRFENEDGEELDQGPGALVAAALAAMHKQTRRQALKELSRDALHRAWQRLSRETSLPALPWIGLGHLRSVSLLDESDSPLPQRVVDRQRGLGRLINRLNERQVMGEPELGPRDVIGGFQLRDRPEGAPPSPDWQSAPVLTLLANSLREKGITEGRDRLGWVLSSGLAARFLGQLMVDRPSCYYIPMQEHAVGGLRLALWNNEMPVSASAMGLLAVTELQMTLAEADNLLPAGTLPGPDRRSQSVPKPGREAAPSGQNTNPGAADDDASRLKR